MRYYNSATFHQNFVELCVFVASFIAIQFMWNWQATDRLLNLIIVTIFILVGCITDLVHMRHTRKFPDFLWGFVFGNALHWLIS